VDGDGTAVPDQGDGRSGLLAASRTNHPPLGRDVRVQCAVWKGSVDDVRKRLMTPSQAESPSAPEGIEDQQDSGGPYETVSLSGAVPMTNARATAS
jgi:hypothetical protein